MHELVRFQRAHDGRSYFQKIKHDQAAREGWTTSLRRILILEVSDWIRQVSYSKNW